jgi:uracil-DNA glycosylase family 4
MPDLYSILDQLQTDPTLNTNSNGAGATALGKRILNTFPTTAGIVPYRIAIVGEAPGKDEVEQGKPFVGAAGQLLTNLLTDAGINRSFCFVGNVCQYRPPDNNLSAWSWEDPRIQLSLEQLRQDIQIFNPNLVILLGNNALRAAKGTYHIAIGKSKKLKEKTYSISDWRGSLFYCDVPTSPFYGRKCLATYHPSYLFRVFSDIPFVRFDLARAKRHAANPDYKEPHLVLDTQPTFKSICERLSLIKQHKIPFAMDIEGYVNDITCLSISPTASEAFIIPFSDMDDTSYWSIEDEAEIFRLLAEVLEDPDIPKTLQNGMYDRFVLAYSWKMLIRNMRDDIMLKHWELYCEFEKSLAMQTSIYTEHAFYKSDRKTDNRDTYWRYCCKDSAITNECSQRQTLLLSREPRSLAHYNFNISLLDPFLFIELKGMKVDAPKKALRLAELHGHAWFNSKKQTSGGVEQQRLEEMVGWRINVNSVKDMQRLVYEQLKLPPVRKERANGSFSLTTDEGTLLKLGKKTKNEVLLQCLKVRRIRKRASGLESLAPDEDGRIRSSTNIVGTQTGRTTSSKAPTGKGTNLTTVTPADRDIIIADPEHDFCQCDLEGADSWTVAMHAARLGDPTMLDDLLFGIKPAQALAMLVLHGPEANKLDRAALKALIKSSDLKGKNAHIYFMCKKGSHGSNYLMGVPRLAELIYIDSEGEIDISDKEVAKIQHLYFLRYKGVLNWHSWAARELKTKGALVAASGSKRLFFGRKDAHDTLAEFCSSEPQHNTTYATNTALRRLWLDPDNRLSSGHLRIWPCHQVHDALCVQWHVRDRDFARQKMRDYFNNTLIIAGKPIVIPFEGKFGPSWGEQPNAL